MDDMDPTALVIGVVLTVAALVGYYVVERRLRP